MTNESDRFWDRVVRPLQEPSRLSPSTPAEAQADFNAAGKSPLSENLMNAITARVLGTASDQAQPTPQLAPEASGDSAERAPRGAIEDPGQRRPRRSILYRIAIPIGIVRHAIRTSRMTRYAAVAAAIVAVLVGVELTSRLGRGRTPAPSHSPFALLAESYAAEANLFAGPRIVHLRNQIVVAPVADATWAQSRWLPLVSLEATGKVRLHQVALPAEVNKGYTVEDQCWYDPPTGRFVRLLTCDGKPIFANAYDAANVYTLETPAGGTLQVISRPVAGDFRPPQNPAEVLGIGAGLRNNIDPTNEAMVQDAGQTVLEDGAEGRLVRLGLPPADDMPQESPYWLVTIRLDNDTVESMEWRDSRQSLLVIRRAKAEPDQGPTVGWDLAGLAAQPARAPAAIGPSVRADMVVTGISVEEMVRKADFATYVFAKDPAWAGRPPVIDDVLDVVSPPKRMFGISYRAKDGRHVVLVQSPSYNKALGPLARTGALTYTSPAGIKVWGGPRGPWLAGILLQSTRHHIKDAPGKDLTGYILETPEGTFPALAVNGKITDDELHAIIDSLIPAKDAIAAGRTSTQPHNQQPAPPDVDHPQLPE